MANKTDYEVLCRVSQRMRMLLAELGTELTPDEMFDSLLRSTREDTEGHCKVCKDYCLLYGAADILCLNCYRELLNEIIYGGYLQ
jgi:hypothetical protein